MLEACGYWPQPPTRSRRQPRHWNDPDRDRLEAVDEAWSQVHLALGLVYAHLDATGLEDLMAGETW
jgi:hypothetical protein